MHCIYKPEEFDCEKCDGEGKMFHEPDKSSPDGFRWRCRNERCYNSEKSKFGSPF